MRTFYLQPPQVRTEEGKQLYQKVAKRESIEFMMSCLNEKERKALSEYMDRMRERALAYLGVYEKPVAPPSYK